MILVSKCKLIIDPSNQDTPNYLYEPFLKT
jgi:hypothetical protein